MSVCLWFSASARLKGVLAVAVLSSLLLGMASEVRGL